MSGLRLGAVVAVAAVGLNLAYAVTRIPNLAHGELITIGAVLAWYLNDAGVPLVLAGIGAVLGGAVLGAVLDVGLFAPMRRRHLEPTTALVATIGLSLLLRNLVLVVFGAGQRPFADAAVQTPWHLGPLDLLPKDAAVIAASALVLTVTAAFLVRTNVGTGLRASGDEPDLAEVSGIDTSRARRLAWVLSAALAAAGGVLAAVSDSVQWSIGPRLLLVVFAAVVVGGLGDVWGAAVGGLFVGLAIELSTWWIDSDFKLLVALVVLVITVLIRPRGFLGRSTRAG